MKLFVKSLEFGRSQDVYISFCAPARFHRYVPMSELVEVLPVAGEVKLHVSLGHSRHDNSKLILTAKIHMIHHTF